MLTLSNAPFVNTFTRLLMRVRKKVNERERENNKTYVHMLTDTMVSRLLAYCCQHPFS